MKAGQKRTERSTIRYFELQVDMVEAKEHDSRRILREHHDQLPGLSRATRPYIQRCKSIRRQGT